MEEEIETLICPKCKGLGRYEHSISQNKVTLYEEGICTKCHGTGELDWLQNLIPARPYWEDSSHAPGRGRRREHRVVPPFRPDRQHRPPDGLH